ncbi:hypothetical protein [Nonomuraea sp. NPDC046570]|uniref:hypothetical protein n=1 Tax=Nonomuraea sp. NPDC046570 TaxID=3155255 RepID=UPI003407ABFF
MRRARSTATLLAVLWLGGCGGCGASEPATPTAPPSPAPQQAVRPKAAAVSMSCGPKARLRTGYLPRGLKARTSLRAVRPLGKVRGYRWKTADGQWLAVGVVCGVRGAGHLVSLVATASLDMHKGRPAIRWTRGRSSYVLWLDRPGTAVLVAASSALTLEIPRVMTGIKGNPSPR